MKELKMTDVGTRLEHIADLKELWETAFHFLSMRNAKYMSQPELDNKAKLEIGLDLLNAHITKDYTEESEYRREINDLGRRNV
jgi:hypothetical protein